MEDQEVGSKKANVVMCGGIDAVVRYGEEDMYFLRMGVADMWRPLGFCCAIDWYSRV